MGDLIDGRVPGDIFPLVGTGAPHLRVSQSTVIQDFLLQGSAFGTQGATIDRMIGVAFHVHHLRSHVLGFITKRVDDHAATHRAIRTRRAGFSGAGDLKFFCLCQNRASIKP